MGSDLGKRKNRWGEDASGPGRKSLPPSINSSLQGHCCAGLILLIVFPVGSLKRKKIYIPTDGDINYLGTIRLLAVFQTCFTHSLPSMI